MAEQLDHIEKYLKGELSNDDRAKFEKSLEEDAVLKEQVEQHLQLQKGLEIGFNQELKELLIDEEANIVDAPVRETARIKTLYPLLGVAATVALIIIVYFSLKTSPLSSDELYARYYEIYPNVEAPVSRSENTVDSPYTYYERGDYATALKLFDDMRTKDHENSALFFYSGMCQLELNRLENGIELFSQVINLGSNKYSRPAMWYQSLAYLKLGNTEKATAIFEQIQRGEDVYARKAHDLLEHL